MLKALTLKSLTKITAFSSLFLAVAVSKAQAVCPICTVAVGAGLGFSRYLGIDDVVTGLWIGAVIVSSALWTASWLDSKNWRLPKHTLLVLAIFYLLVIPPLYWTGMIDYSDEQMWGVNKIILGTIIGSVAFLFGVFVDKFLRSLNEGKVFVYFQKVIAPVLTLSIISVIFYLIT